GRCRTDRRRPSAGANCNNSAWASLVTGGADGRTRTDTACATAPSRQRVYQFHHIRISSLVAFLGGRRRPGPGRARRILRRHLGHLRLLRPRRRRIVLKHGRGIQIRLRRRHRSGRLLGLRLARQRPFEHALRRRLLGGEEREREARDEKGGREHRGQPRQKARRAPGAEYRAGCAGAEPRARFGALAPLQQNEPNDHQARQDVKQQYDRLQHWLVPPAPQREEAAPKMVKNSEASSDAPPTRPPSMSSRANRSAAFAPLTLPPYRMIRPAAIVASCAAIIRRIRAWTSCACSGVALLPVPIAQTGS